jgi:predicted TIM-barrel fold metal-dependent hydrolase
MIDCHAHAFPTLYDQLAKISPRAAEAAHAWTDRIKQHIPHAIADRVSHAMDHAIFDVESLAETRRKSDVSRRFEAVIALGMLPQVAAAGSIDHLLASMERNGIHKTVLIAGEPVATNEWVLAQARAHEGKLVPVVNMPAMREDATLAQWGDALTELAQAGAAGFKIHLNMDGLGHAHRAYGVAFEVAEEHGLFIIVHTGCFHALGYKTAEPAEPALFAPLFEEHKKVRVCLAHMNRDEPEKAWDVMTRFDHVFADTSWQPREALKRAVRKVGADRILLGSDWPLLHPNLQHDVSTILREAVGTVKAERIGEKNARAFLGG